MHLSFKLVQSPFALNSGQPCNGSTLFAGEFGTARVVLDAGACPRRSAGSLHTEFATGAGHGVLWRLLDRDLGLRDVRDDC